MSLTVYSSSAGSGKTTTLVNEYLKIALNKPNHFRHILAITFTNKAANEMKERVIETLQDFTDINKPIDNKHSCIPTDLGISDELLRERSKLLLTLILHNYDEFAISTIDSFIHRIIRTFATDVRLPQNFEVVIDESDIIPEVIHNLYEKVGYDKELTNILIDFVLSQADEEASYDPTLKLIDFVNHHLREDGFKHIKKLDNLSLTQLSDIISRLRKKIATEKALIIENADNAITLCDEKNLIAQDFAQGKNGILGYFEKIRKFNAPDDKLFPGKNAEKTIAEEIWFAKNTNQSKQDIILSISNELTEYYFKILVRLKNYLYYKLVYSKIYSLALIHEIRKTFAELTEQTGKVHISEFNKKISDEISNQPVPYIYERLGRKYRHYLIDEFQDTSVLQWQNLLPLIEESLAYNRLNMLVGDAKQAIYRFRSGEVELFTSLPVLHGNDNSQISAQRQNTITDQYKEEILKINYRSETEIINFNNDFFSTITETLSPRTKDIYKDLHQDIPENKQSGGFVSLNFFESETPLEYLQKKHDRIFEILTNAFEKGFTKKDICILCRTKKKATGIAEYLLENDINVVSSESLLITNSPKVRLIIAFLRLYSDPYDSISEAAIIDNYIKSVEPERSFHKEVKRVQNSRSVGVKKVLSSLNIEASDSNLIALSTYEIAEFILREIIGDNKPDVFIQYLLDFIFENNLPVQDFLSRWDEKSSKLYITMTDDIDAIRIMTIHKAKGLDFPVVIVDAENNKNPNTKTEYWEDINLEDFKDLKVALMPLNKKLELIDRLDIYEDEQRKTELDFLNLIYVATTRPVYALYTLGQIGTKDKFSEYLLNYLSIKNLWEDNKLNYEYGELKAPRPSTTETITKSEKLDSFISSNWADLISVAHSDSIVHDALTGKSTRSYGNLIHGILANIYYSEDLQRVMGQISDSGIMSHDELAIIENIITDIITNPDLKKYFEKKCIVKNETEILLDNGHTIRPDRVVIDGDQVTIIDYKTGEEKEDDHKQLIDYRNTFLAMDYSNIESKLVYLTDAIRIVNVV